MLKSAFMSRDGHGFLAPIPSQRDSLTAPLMRTCASVVWLVYRKNTPVEGTVAKALKWGHSVDVPGTEAALWLELRDRGAVGGDEGRE